MKKELLLEISRCVDCPIHHDNEWFCRKVRKPTLHPMPDFCPLDDKGTYVRMDK